MSSVSPGAGVQEMASGSRRDDLELHGQGRGQTASCNEKAISPSSLWLLLIVSGCVFWCRSWRALTSTYFLLLQTRAGLRWTLPLATRSSVFSLHFQLFPTYNKDKHVPQNVLIFKKGAVGQYNKDNTCRSYVDFSKVATNEVWKMLTFNNPIR